MFFVWFFRSDERAKGLANPCFCLSTGRVAPFRCTRTRCFVWLNIPRRECCTSNMAEGIVMAAVYHGHLVVLGEHFSQEVSYKVL